MPDMSRNDIGKQESQRLQHVVETIDEKLELLSHPPESGPVYRNAASVQTQSRREQQEQLARVRPKPYFARVDFQKDASESPVVSLYFGQLGIYDSSSLRLVYDWRAPIAHLFYDRSYGRSEYNDNQGNTMHGTVSLHREFTIEEAQLIKWEDLASVGAKESVIDVTSSAAGELDNRLHDDSSQDTNIPISHEINMILSSVLSENREPGLREIAPTIQAEQYGLINAPVEGALIIQGVAGSGKSSVALHRLAYLLYESNSTFKAHNTLLIAPSRLFLDNIAGVLPALHENNVQQMTLTNWAEKLLGENLQLEDLEDAVRDVSNSAAGSLSKIGYQYIARLKASLRMAHILDAYLRILESRHIKRANSIKVDYSFPDDPDLLYNSLIGKSISLVLSDSTVIATIRPLAHSDGSRWTPLNERHALVADRLIEILWQQLVQRAPSQSGGILDARKRAFKQALQAPINRQIRHWWPVYSAIDCYKMLMTVDNQLEIAAEALINESLSEWECALMRSTVNRHGRFNLSNDDIPALCYLHVQLNGRHLGLYDHVVVDEAQDLSPLQLLVISQHVHEGSMTLVGDMAQSLSRYDSSTWDLLEGALENVTVRRANLTISYRATKEITEIANNVLVRLRDFGLQIPLARPVSRSGKKPKQVGYTSAEQHLDGVSKAIESARESNCQSIAVLCRTTLCCEQLHKSLVLDVPDLKLIINRDEVVDRTVVMMPVHLAKGLEFDAVIIADADDKSYPDELESAKMLYVAMTRALHFLYVTWLGKKTPLVTSSRRLRRSEISH